MSEIYDNSENTEIVPKTFIRVTKEEAQEVIAGPNYTLVGTSFTANELRKKLSSREWAGSSLVSAIMGLASISISFCRFQGYISGINTSFFTISFGFVSMIVGIYSLSNLRSNGKYKGITAAFFGVVASFIAVCLTLL